MKSHRMIASVAVSFLWVWLAVACGGGAAVGEGCSTAGSVDECEDGAVCDSDAGGAVICLAICDKQDDCASDESCNGVSGSNLKACQHLTK